MIGIALRAGVRRKLSDGSWATPARLVTNFFVCHHPACPQHVVKPSPDKFNILYSSLRLNTFSATGKIYPKLRFMQVRCNHSG